MANAVCCAFAGVAVTSAAGSVSENVVTGICAKCGLLFDERREFAGHAEHERVGAGDDAAFAIQVILECGVF